jgi:hypothetical protein
MLRPHEQGDRVMAVNEDITGRRGPDPVKLGGFAAGMAATLLLGLIASVAYSGHGIGDVAVPPPQVYTNF